MGGPFRYCAYNKTDYGSEDNHSWSRGEELWGDDVLVDMFTLSGSTAQLKWNEGNPINLQVVSVLGIYLMKGQEWDGMEIAINYSAGDKIGTTENQF